MLDFQIEYEKTYDMVSKSFLFYMMHRLEFCGKWVGWMKSCLESVSFSILLNGSPTLEFKPQRGLREGERFSSFLFLVIVEALSGLMRRVMEKICLKAIGWELLRWRLISCSLQMILFLWERLVCVSQ